MEDGDTFVSLVQFNHEIETIYKDRPVEDAAELSDENFEPAGRTAYYDALARAIETGPDDDTLFFVVTDGEENASTDTSQSDVQELVEEAQDEGHEFMLMDGSGQSEELAAEEIGISEDRARSYDSTSGDATRNAYVQSAKTSASLRADDESDKQT